MEEKISELSAKNEILKSENIKLQNDQKNLQEKISQLSSENTKCQKENKNLTQLLQKIQSEAENKNAQIIPEKELKIVELQNEKELSFKLSI